MGDIKRHLLGLDSLPFELSHKQGSEPSPLDPFRDISWELDEVEQFIMEQEKGESLYLRSLCRGIQSEVLDPLYETLSEHAFRQSVRGRCRDCVSVSCLHVLLHHHNSIINATVRLIRQIRANCARIRGVRIADLIWDLAQSGIPCVANVFKKIMQEYIDVVLLNQIISWIVYGILSDPYGEFWIEHNSSANSSWNLSYQMNVLLLPDSYLSFETCRSILFIGKALRVCRPEKSSNTFASHERYLTQIVPFVRDRSGLQEQFAVTIEELRQAADTSLWQYIVEEQDLIFHLTQMKSFFFLANGAFFEEFIVQCGDLVFPQVHRSLSINFARNAFQCAARKFHLDDSESFQRFKLCSRWRHGTVDFRKDTSSFSICGRFHVADDNDGITFRSCNEIGDKRKGAYGSIWCKKQCCIAYGFHVAFTIELRGCGVFSFVMQNQSEYAQPDDLLSSLWVDFEHSREYRTRLVVRHNSDVLKSWSDCKLDLFDSRQHHVSIKWLPYDLKNEKASFHIMVDDDFKCNMAADRLIRKMRLLGHRCFIGLCAQCHINEDDRTLFRTRAISWRELQEPTSVSQIDLSLDFRIPKGIDLLLGTQEIDRYSDIFSFLLRIKFVHWYLRRAWTTNDDLRSCSHEIFLLRSRMQFLIDNLQIYLQVDVIETQFAKLVASIRSTRDFEAIRLAHDRYLAVLAQHFFLRSQVILRALAHVLDICLQFCRVLDDSKTEQIEAQIHSFAERFHRESCFLFSVISGKTRHQSSQHLEQLILRIDYNEYFSSLLTEAGLK